jgi:hypothetical protein
MRSILRTQPGAHSSDGGHGRLLPISLLKYGVEHVFDKVLFQAEAAVIIAIPVACP